jgi:poly(3-hydroxybutyrate) depolymerase
MSTGTRHRLAWSLAAVILGAFAAAAMAANADGPAPLPALHANITETSVSGISAGAYMAGQFQIAHSEIVAGAAIIAGGPYGCAESIYADIMVGPAAVFLNLSKAINGCMLNGLALWGVPDPQLLATKVRRLAEDGRIDPLDGLLADRVYLFSGTEDHTVVPSIVAAAVEFYARLGLKPDQLKFVTNIHAGHAFVTDGEGAACGLSAKPFVVDCDYDQAGEVLAHIYGKLNPRSETPTGAYIEFDQQPFTSELADPGLADRGVVYVPRTCASTATCRVHIAFHGCAQDKAAVGDAFVHDTGFARWADTNALVVLFPQVAASTMNPQGCWDWWGYTGHDYLTRDAPQIVAVHRMLLRLAAARSGS